MNLTKLVTSNLNNMIVSRYNENDAKDFLPVRCNHVLVRSKDKRLTKGSETVVICNVKPKIWIISKLLNIILSY